MQSEYPDIGEENIAKGSLQSQHDTDQCMYVNKSLKSRGKGITWKDEKEQCLNSHRIGTLHILTSNGEETLTFQDIG